MKKLNLGCGYDIRPGWVNLDIAPLKGVDVVHDLARHPLPFRNEEFEYVLCSDILEHIFDYPSVLREIHRVLRPGGTVEIRTPHYSYSRAYADPTHVRFFSIETFDFFIKTSGRPYYYDFSFSEIASIKLTFRRGFIKPLVSWIANRNRKTYEFYEQSFLSALCPAENIIVKLRK